MVLLVFIASYDIVCCVCVYTCDIIILLLCACFFLQAAHNCFIGDRNVVKVADFGLARFVIDDEYTASEGTMFPIRWAAPEVITHAKFSSRSDVWSYGEFSSERERGGGGGREKGRERYEKLCLSQVFYYGSCGLEGETLIQLSPTHKWWMRF